MPEPKTPTRADLFEKRAALAERLAKLVRIDPAKITEVTLDMASSTLVLTPDVETARAVRDVFLAAAGMEYDALELRIKNLR